MDKTKEVLSTEVMEQLLKEAQIDEDLQLLGFNWLGYIRDANVVHTPDAFVRWHLLHIEGSDIYAVTYDDGNGYVSNSMTYENFKKGYDKGEYRKGIPGHIGAN